MIRRLSLLLLPLLWSCGGSDPVPLSADKTPLHLEEHLKTARIEGSEVPKDLPEAAAWDFAKPQPGWKARWKAVLPLLPGAVPAAVRQAEGALRVEVTEANRQRRGFRGGVYVDLPDWNREDWAFLLVRARTSGGARNLTVGFNLRRQHGDMMFEYEPFLYRGDSATLIGDGAVHDYLLRADWVDFGAMEEPLRQLGLMLNASAPGRLEILSVALVPKEARYAELPAGVVTEPRDALYRRALYTHAPGKVSWRVRVPKDGRLDFGLGVLRQDAPVTFRVLADGKPVFEESYARKGTWGQRSADLARWAGKAVDLTLETAGKAGSVALWSAPTVSGAPLASGPPNVLLYVIDAGGAEYMSAYGYNRRTTPNLERLAAEGALFERAYSNSSWSKPSTTSFMTGLHHTVLGGFKLPNDPLPDRAATMAQILHGAGYQTGVFTSNSWCGSMSSLDRGVDNLIESIAGPNSESSGELQRAFWRWREAYPGRPWWAHFQVTDVHWPWQPVPPVAGTFLSPAQRAAFNDMERRLGEATGTMGRSWGLRAATATFEKAGIERQAYFDGVRGAFDEAMAYSDHQLGVFVDRLKATGEWENTILIVTADHGDWPGLGYFDAWAPFERVAYLNPYLTRVPLVVVWPAKIKPGQRFRGPVSLIDLLPTVLDLAGRPKPDYLQGQSLAPLLLGQPGWKPRPVVIDELTYSPMTGDPNEIVEIVDGRWGASLQISKEEEGPRLLLYDLWNDPYCLKSLHAEKPELAKKYTGILERTFREHQALAKKFPRGKGGAMDSEQLKTLQSLGYI
ncbi:MAG: sulfatase [Thermoanaerobaculia bacterium]